MVGWLLNLLGGPELFRKQIASVLRTLLAMLAGILAGAGLGLDADQIDNFINFAHPILVAVVMYAIAQGWSWLEKLGKAK